MIRYDSNTAQRQLLNAIILTKFSAFQVYARIQSGEYKIEEGWDGIKPSALFGRPNSLDFNLVVAEPEKSTCC